MHERPATLVNQPNCDPHNLQLNTLFLQTFHSSEMKGAQHVDELNLGSNVVLKSGNRDFSLVNNNHTATEGLATFTNPHEIEGCVALATSTPLAKEIIPATPSINSTTTQLNTNINIDQYQANGTVDEIASKLGSLDDTNLVRLQELIIQQRLANLPTNSVSVTEIATQPILNTFVPVGTITCDYQKSNPTSDVDEKPDIIMKDSHEQVFNIPNSMIAYIYNKETQNVMKVKLIEENEDLSRYAPVPTKDEEMQNQNLQHLKGQTQNVEDTNEITGTSIVDEIPLLASQRNSGRRNLHKKTFRKVTARWNKVRN